MNWKRASTLRNVTPKDVCSQKVSPPLPKKILPYWEGDAQVWVGNCSLNVALSLATNHTKFVVLDAKTKWKWWTVRSNLREKN
jgi:hypothetical protein